MPRWLLPESISDILPSEARRIEELRRVLLDLYRSYGYELVQPPLLEHLDSLLTGSGGDLGLRTFQLVDQLSGRILGLRADMTPQVARIDAHLLNRQGIVRLCYAGPVLHTRPAGLFASREPLHIGAEVYGHAGIEADLEIIELMTRSLRQATRAHIRIDLCHSGIVPALLALDPALEEEVVCELLVRKDLPGLQACLAGSPAQVREALLALPSLYGGLHEAGTQQDVLALARRTLPALPGISAALDQLQQLARSARWSGLSGVELSLELADLRGYRYHSGITFAAYVDGLPNTVARGGRYDNVGRAFGRARPATGFSLELRELAGMRADEAPTAAIRAPWEDSAALISRMQALRDQGEIVIQALPGHEHEHEEFACDRELVFDQGQWVVRPLAAN